MKRHLANLLRLRRFEADTARRALAEALAAEADAQARLARAQEALAAEAGQAGSLRDRDALVSLRNFAAWLPRGAAARQAAARAVAVAAQAAAAARAALAERRAALEAVEKLVEAAAREDRQHAARREAHALDDIFRARRG
jgi:flagellar export protein FliJ